MSQVAVVGEILHDEIKACRIKPRRHSVMITINLFGASESNLEISTQEDDMIDDWQYVVAVGDNTEYEVGDKVLVDFDKLKIRVPDPNDTTKYMETINIKPTESNGKYYTIISDSYLLAREVEYPQVEDLRV